MFAVIKWLVNVRCLFIYLKYLVLDIYYSHYFVLEKRKNGMKKKLSDNFFYKCLVGPMSRRTYVLSDLCPFGPMSYRTNVLSDLCHSDLCPSDLCLSDLCLSDLCRCTGKTVRYFMLECTQILSTRCILVAWTGFNCIRTALADKLNFYPGALLHFPSSVSSLCSGLDAPFQFAQFSLIYSTTPNLS